MRYALDVQYIGKYYSGSQIQFEGNRPINKPTIQGELERALCTLIIGGKYTANNNTRQIKTIFSGRTDKGVNALGQVIHFDTNKEIVASSFIYHLNEILPKDISVNNLRNVPSSWHAQKSATARYYRYELINRRYKQAFDGDILRVKYDLDVERMQNALNFIKGEHDFSSFKSSGTLNPSKVCTLTRADVEKQGDRVFIHVEGNRFLYNMVRAIVGTLLDIEGHKLPVEHMKEVLEAHDRRKAGQTVSPFGLTLMKVSY
jgi:tRNA pseudouridine38-40 synthase